jgi:hypothetical protein
LIKHRQGMCVVVEPYRRFRPPATVEASPRHHVDEPLSPDTAPTHVLVAFGWTVSNRAQGHRFLSPLLAVSCVRTGARPAGGYRRDALDLPAEEAGPNRKNRPWAGDKETRASLTWDLSL